jgi:hypothetical protein
VPDVPLGPAHDRLGSEGLARLRARYSEILAAISARVPDAERRDQLKETAERLNPDGWVTPEEVKGGLEQYEVLLESLRDALGRRRSRRRRRSTSDDGTSSTPDEPATLSPGDDPDEGTPDDRDAGPALPEDDPSG